MCTLPFCRRGGEGKGGLSLQPNFQKGCGLDRISIFREGLLGKRGWFFQGGCSFYIKNKLKNKLKLFSVITKNFNWEILIKNLVTFKSWDRVKDKKFENYGVHWKILFLGGFTRNQYIGGNCLKGGGGLGQFSDLRGSFPKKRGMVFLRVVVDTPMHTML